MAGILVTPKEALMAMLAESATFRAALGVSTSADARLHIHYNRLVAFDHHALRPYAIVATQGGAWPVTSGGARNHHLAEGTLWLYLSDRVRHADRDADARAFDTFAGGVLGDVADLSAEDDNLAIRDMTIELPPVCYSVAMEDASDQGPEAEFWCMSLLVEWGA